MSEMLLERLKKKSFLHRVITGYEKWIHYDNPKRKIICEIWPTKQINSKAKYPWCEGNALYLVMSEGCVIL